MSNTTRTTFSGVTAYWLVRICCTGQSGNWPKRTVACDDFGGCWLRECCGHTHSWREQTEWLQGHTKEEVWDFAAKELIT